MRNKIVNLVAFLLGVEHLDKGSKYGDLVAELEEDIDSREVYTCIVSLSNKVDTESVVSLLKGLGIFEDVQVVGLGIVQFDGLYVSEIDAVDEIQGLLFAHNIGIHSIAAHLKK